MAHTGDADRSELLDMARWRREWRPTEWKRVLEQPQDEAELSSIRLATHRGRPLGSDSFLSKLERRLGRRLRPLPIGRPKNRETAQKGNAKKRRKAEK